VGEDDAAFAQMSASSASPIGCIGRVAKQGAIRPGRVGEVLVSIRGGLESFLAEDADGGAIEADEEIVVVDYRPPRTVLVTRLNGEPTP
jgi:hypothetical protein